MMQSCSECGKEVSSQAKTCPHCGIRHPGLSGGERTVKTVVKGIACLGCLILVLFFFGMCGLGMCVPI